MNATAPGQQARLSHYEITAKDLPLYCPQDEKNTWQLHPRVYLPIEATGEATCPYCGAHYVLRGGAHGH